MSDGVERQRAVMTEVYDRDSAGRWSFHYTSDPLTRYLRDRRLTAALRILRRHGRLDPARQSVLLVCGGVGGEGTFLMNAGFRNVTVSDFSAEALRLCESFDPRLRTRLLDAEAMTDLADGSHDLVFVQDGLHHLPRPVLGFTEMLRVAREAAVVIEPHLSLVATLIGTKWEVQGDAVNFVFRWDGTLLRQVASSSLLRPDVTVVPHRLWDHPLVVSRLVGRLPGPVQLTAAKAVYGALSPVRRAGNMMVGVVVKPTGSAPPRLRGH